MPVALIILIAVCFTTAFGVSAAVFRVINGVVPPNLWIVVAVTSIAAALPLMLQSMPTIRNLQESRDKLRETHTTLANRVVELDETTRMLDLTRQDLENRVMRRTRELEAARGMAEQANRAKSAFLAQMSHELRTPLNAIIGFSELLSTSDTMPAQTRLSNVEEYAQIIQKSGRHLLSLVSDLLDLSKIEAGKMDLSIERIDLATLVSNAESVISADVKAKGQKFVHLLDPAVGTLEADHRALMQILLNLLSNAVKYSPPGTTIILSCTSAGDRVAFTIRDEGAGMTAEEIKQSMQPFTRVFDVETANESGTGLGLYIVASLVEMQGGRFSLTSEPGVGTEARFCLPHRVATEKAPAVSARREKRDAVA